MVSITAETNRNNSEIVRWRAGMIRGLQGEKKPQPLLTNRMYVLL
jgi:hypothetical protein